ncbi:hypothetical protein SAMN04883147_11211, partial [Streptomyces sp. DpondAA-F4]
MARRIAPALPGVRASASGGADTPATAPSTAPTAPAVVQRSRSLLADRPLSVSTGAGEGFTAPPPAAGAEAPARPVVKAAWRREPTPVEPPDRPLPLTVAHGPDARQERPASP